MFELSSVISILGPSATSRKPARSSHVANGYSAYRLGTIFLVRRLGDVGDRIF